VFLFQVLFHTLTIKARRPRVF